MKTLQEQTAMLRSRYSQIGLNADFCLETFLLKRFERGSVVLMDYEDAATDEEKPFYLVILLDAPDENDPPRIVDTHLCFSIDEKTLNGLEALINHLTVEYK